MKNINKQNSKIKTEFNRNKKFDPNSLDEKNLYIYRKDLFSEEQKRIYYEIRQKEKIEINMKKNLFCIINSPNSLSSKFYKENPEQFNWYLAGLFTGDGNLSWSVNRKIKTGKKHPKIEITLHTKEATTAFWLSNMIGTFTQQSSISNCWRARSSKKDVIKNLYERLNGKIFLPSKVKQMKELSEYFNIPFKECNINKIDFTKNAFLSGFFDAEGSWYLKKEKYRNKIIWCICQKDKNILRIIQQSFNRKKKNGNVGSINDQNRIINKKLSYKLTYWSIWSYKEDINIMLDYFEKFPLKTIKHLGVKRYKLLKEHYKYKTYKPENRGGKTELVALFNEFINNFTTPLKDGETEEDFLKKYEIPKIY